MHISLMRIKASTEAAFDRLLSNPNITTARDPRKAVKVFMDRQIDAWMEDGYRKAKTMSDILDNRRHAILAKGLKRNDQR